MSLISPHAIIEEGSIIADDVEIGAFCFISSKSKSVKGLKFPKVLAFTGIRQSVNTIPFFPMPF